MIDQPGDNKSGNRADVVPVKNRPSPKNREMLTTRVRSYALPPLLRLQQPCHTHFSAGQRLRGEPEKTAFPHGCFPGHERRRPSQSLRAAPDRHRGLSHLRWPRRPRTRAPRPGTAGGTTARLPALPSSDRRLSRAVNQRRWHGHRPTTGHPRDLSHRGAAAPTPSPSRYPGHALACQLYLEGGIRCAQLGSLYLGNLDENNELVTTALTNWSDWIYPAGSTPKATTNTSLNCSPTLPTAR